LVLVIGPTCCIYVSQTSHQVVKLILLQLSEYRWVINQFFDDTQSTIKFNIFFIVVKSWLSYKLEYPWVGCLDMRLIKRSWDISSFLWYYFFKILTLYVKDDVKVELFQFLRRSFLLLSLTSSFPHFLFLLLCFNLSDHTRQILEETLRMVINIIFFILINSKIILFLGNSNLIINLCLLLQKFDIKLHHNFSYMLSNLLYERINNVLLRV
jgi:hypothetical protein